MSKLIGHLSSVRSGIFQTILSCELGLGSIFNSRASSTSPRLGCLEKSESQLASSSMPSTSSPLWVFPFLPVDVPSMAKTSCNSAFARLFLSSAVWSAFLAQYIFASPVLMASPTMTLPDSTIFAILVSGASITTLALFTLASPAMKTFSTSSSFYLFCFVELSLCLFHRFRRFRQFWTARVFLASQVSACLSAFVPSC